MFGWANAFDKCLDKATSQVNLEPDWASILQICDSIRQGDVQPKYAVNAIKKRLYSQNPHVVLHAISILESCVKNCGAIIHNEIASAPFMEELRDFIKTTPHDSIKNKLLELIQAWAHAFRNEPKYRTVADTVTFLKMEGYKFPPLQESDHMFASDQAPEWKDGDCCHRCRVQFSSFQRKHHCRNCGQIFCSRCSSKTCPIPRYGIEKEVRVCDPCWDHLNKPTTQKVDNSESSPIQSTKSPNSKTNSKEQELREEEELQLAIALSKSEAEIKEQKKKKSSNGVTKSTSTLENKEMDPELAYYLNRDYWEQRQQEETRSSPQPSAPISAPSGDPQSKLSPPHEKLHNGEAPLANSNGLADQQQPIEEFVSQLKTTIEIFVNRMKSDSSRGRPIALDTYVQSLFMNLTNQHAQLLKAIQEQDDARIHYETLQDKLGQIRDARAALDALREDHREKLRREAEEAERQRQAQMAQKLEIMRKKKQEYLHYQRELALQKMQEQEREAKLRQQHYQVYSTPAGYQPQPPPPFPPTGAVTPAPGFLPPAAAPPPPQGYNMYNMPGMVNTLSHPGGEMQYSLPPQQQQIGPVPPVSQPPITVAPPPPAGVPPSTEAMPPHATVPAVPPPTTAAPVPLAAAQSEAPQPAPAQDGCLISFD